MAILMAAWERSVSQISIAQARDSLTRLIHEVEAGKPVHITRRGKPVAVLMSQRDHEALGADVPRENVWQAIQMWRAEEDFDWPDLTPDEVSRWRDRSSGRAVQWPD